MAKAIYFEIVPGIPKHGWSSFPVLRPHSVQSLCVCSILITPLNHCKLRYVSFDLEQKYDQPRNVGHVCQQYYQEPRIVDTGQLISNLNVVLNESGEMSATLSGNT
jgi:hypothetical protein